MFGRTSVRLLVSNALSLLGNSIAAIALIPIVDMIWGLNFWWFVALGLLGVVGDIPDMTAQRAAASRHQTRRCGPPTVYGVGAIA